MIQKDYFLSKIINNSSAPDESIKAPKGAFFLLVKNDDVLIKMNDQDKVKGMHPLAYLPDKFMYCGHNNL